MMERCVTLRQIEMFFFGSSAIPAKSEKLCTYTLCKPKQTRVLAATNQNQRYGPSPQIVPCLGRYRSNIAGHRTSPAGAAHKRFNAKTRGRKAEPGTRHSVFFVLIKKKMQNPLFSVFFLKI
jgi:hypothetical protein